MFKKTSVSGDWLDYSIECFLKEKRWNGWACPYFTFENAKKVIKDWANLVYEEDKDRFVWSDENLDEPEIYEATTIEVDGEKIKVYGIGYGSWCWFEE